MADAAGAETAQKPLNVIMTFLTICPYHGQELSPHPEDNVVQPLSSGIDGQL